jgi:hypothetical protein
VTEANVDSTVRSIRIPNTIEDYVKHLAAVEDRSVSAQYLRLIKEAIRQRRELAPDDDDHDARGEHDESLPW